ncbi:hypothetical protein A2U01_0023943, partial [Trifolium medium]|nr:hypothetical protein [Trifolium medium]
LQRIQGITLEVDAWRMVLKKLKEATITK